MKLGPRTPNVSKRISSRTTGKITRKAKSATNPIYGKKGTGLVTDPKRAAYNHVYNKTTFDTLSCNGPETDMNVLVFGFIGAILSFLLTKFATGWLFWVAWIVFILSIFILLIFALYFLLCFVERPVFCTIISALLLSPFYFLGKFLSINEHKYFIYMFIIYIALGVIFKTVIHIKTKTTDGDEMSLFARKKNYAVLLNEKISILDINSNNFEKDISEINELFNEAFNNIKDGPTKEHIFKLYDSWENFLNELNTI